MLTVLPPVPDDDASSFGSTESHAACEGEGGHGSAGETAKVLATLFSFLVLGAIISTPGVILPHLEAHYQLDDVHASLIFLVAPLGYLIGARLNDPIHKRLGQRGIAVIAPVCQVLFTGAAATLHDPRRGGFPLFLVGTVVGNVGSGLLDGSWCAWAGGLGGQRTNTIQGLLHGSFSVGAGLGPFLAGTIFTVAKAPWWAWYYFLLGAVVIQGVVLTVTFRSENGTRYREGLDGVRNPLERGAPRATEPKTALKHRVTWICALFFLVYVGTESGISGWIVSFMLRARRASTYLASLSSSGFWIAMAAGRFVLGPVTDRVGTRRAVPVYLTVAILAQVVLAAVDVAGVSVAAVVVVGFFLGPLFPSGVVMLAGLLPKELHVGAVSFAASVGQLGAALFPFALGSLAQWVGIQSFQIFILVMLTVALLVWFLFPPRPGIEAPVGDVSRRRETGSRNQRASH